MISTVPLFTSFWGSSKKRKNIGRGVWGEGERGVGERGVGERLKGWVEENEEEKVVVEKEGKIVTKTMTLPLTYHNDLNANDISFSFSHNGTTYCKQKYYRYINW